MKRTNGSKTKRHMSLATWVARSVALNSPLLITKLHRYWSVHSQQIQPLLYWVKCRVLNAMVSSQRRETPQSDFYSCGLGIENKRQKQSAKDGADVLEVKVFFPPSSPYSLTRDNLTKPHLTINNVSSWLAWPHQHNNTGFLFIVSPISIVWFNCPFREDGTKNSA